jgi:hypothetical protein
MVAAAFAGVLGHADLRQGEAGGWRLPRRIGSWRAGLPVQLAVHDTAARIKSTDPYRCECQPYEGPER